MRKEPFQLLSALVDAKTMMFSFSASVDAFLAPNKTFPAAVAITSDQRILVSG